MGLDDLIENEEDEELEECEFLHIDVEDWKPEDEVLPDFEADVDEHVVLQQSKTDIVFESARGDANVDLSEIQSAVNEEDCDNSNFCVIKTRPEP